MRRRHPGRPPRRLSRRHQRWLYLTSSLLLLSGVCWLIAHDLLPARADLPGAPRASEVWWMRLHGAALIGFLVAFGALLPGHVADGWRRRTNRGSGSVMIGVVSLLGLTGYGLYYLGDDTVRAWVSALHWAVGLASAAALLTHVVLGRRTRMRARERHLQHAAPSGSHARAAHPH